MRIKYLTTPQFRINEERPSGCFFNISIELTSMLVDATEKRECGCQKAYGELQMIHDLGCVLMEMDVPNTEERENIIDPIPRESVIRQEAPGGSNHTSGIHLHLKR